MIWVFVGLGLLVVLVAVPMVVGRFLPEDYHARVVAEFDAEPERVWAALLDHHATPITGSRHRSTTDLEPVNGLPAWEEHLGPSTIVVRTTEAVEGVRLARTYADSVVPMTAETVLTLERDGDATRVVADTHITVRDGTWHVPVFRFMLTVASGARRGLREYLSGIGRALEIPTTRL